MERVLPVLNNNTAHITTYGWTSQYGEEDCRIFLESLSGAVITVAQHEGHYESDYLIAELNRADIRSNFEERIRYCVTDPEIGYTERDKELVSEYFRSNSQPLIAKELCR